jgi:ABC-type amino acid transport substrate-binding protein
MAGRGLGRIFLPWLFASLNVFAQTLPAPIPASVLQSAPSPTQPLKVAVVEHPPFVINVQTQPTGFAIDLWQQIAALKHWTFTYVPYPSTEAALKAIAAKQCDVLVNDTSITSARLQSVDFSQPFFHTGLQIMVVDSRPRTFGWLIENVKEILAMPIVWVVVSVLVVLTALVTYFERKHNHDFPKTWREGFLESFTYVISTALTGKSSYKGFPGVAGRLAMVAWMLTGVVAVAFITSTITTTMTIERLQGHINGPQDLPGKTIGVLAGSLAEQYALDQSIQYISYPDLKSAVIDLVGGKLDAIVGEAPELEFYDNAHPEIPITEVGPLFQQHNFGFAVPKDNPLRFELDHGIVKLTEDGDVYQLGHQYFGDVFRL